MKQETIGLSSCAIDNSDHSDDDDDDDDDFVCCCFVASEFGSLFILYV